MALTVAELRAVFTADTSGLARGDAAVQASARKTAASYEQAGRTIDRTTQRSTGFLRSVRTHLGLIGVTGATFGLGALIKQSSQLEQAYGRTMNLVQASTGASGREITKLDALAMKLGADTQFSANDAAGAMLELAKAGIKTNDIYGGALKGTLLLAAAGGTDLGTAATIASNAMNTFNLRGKDMARIASALAGGANASSASVESLGQGLQQVGPGAKNAGLNLQQTVAVLSAFDAAGIKGSDAGTSLKTMLANLVPQTKQAKDAMKALGLDFVDAKGNFVDITEVAQQLKDKLGPLSEAQRVQALSTIFGSDASRAATVLMNQGAKGLTKYIRATQDQTAAQKMADASMAGTAGAMERLRGSVETAELALGKALAPTIRDVANWLSNKGVPAVTGFIDGMRKGKGAGGEFADNIRHVADAGKDLIGVGKRIYGAFSSLPGPVKKTAGELAIAVGLMKKLTGGKISIGSLTGLTKGGLTGGLVGGLASKAGPTPVFVTNPGFNNIVPSGPRTPIVPTPTSTGGGGGGGGLLGGLAAGASIAGSQLGKAAPNLFKVWENFQQKQAIQSALSKATMFSPPAWMVAGGGGMKTSKPGHFLGGDKMITAENVTPKQLAAMSEAEKRILGISKATKGSSKWWDDFAGGVKKAIVTTGKYSKTLSTVPKDIRSFVSTPGSITSLAEMRRIATQYKLTPKQIRTIMELQGFDKTQAMIAAAGKSYTSLPKQVKTAMKADTVKTLADVNRLQKQYNLTPAQKRTVMQVSGVAKAIADARRLRNEIAAIKSKSVTISIHRNNSATGPSVGAYAPDAEADGGTIGRADGGGLMIGGGTVRGVRYPYGDKINTNLAPTEEVTSNRYGQADLFRSELKMINAGASRAQVARALIARGLADGGTVGSALEILEAQRSIRDLTREMAERKTKYVGKGKHRHKVKGGYVAQGLDRQILVAELAEAKKEATRLKGKATPEDADTSLVDQFREQLLGNIFTSGVTTASQLLKNLTTMETSNSQWANMIAGLSKAGISSQLLDQFKKEGPTAQALALGKSILATGNIGSLNNAQSGLGKQADQYAAFATGKAGTPVAAVHIENFNAQDQTPAEIGERFYFISQVRR